MGQAKDAIMRRKIVEMHISGSKYAEIAIEFGINYHTVRTMCLRYKKEGDAGLIPRTANCGRSVKSESECTFRLVRLIAHFHPTWGVPYILVRIRKKYPSLTLQSVRHYQRRLKRHKKPMPKPVLPKMSSTERSREPHACWQIDAKERIRFTDSGQNEGCFLNITDEQTASTLHAESFPPRADRTSPH
jgi:hypothetical protein